MPRVPVRIALAPRELAESPLQIGLSMQVEVDTRNRDGNRLPHTASATPAYKTDVYDSIDAVAAQRVRAIIAANDHDGAKTISASGATASAARPAVTAPRRDAAPRRVANAPTL